MSKRQLQRTKGDPTPPKVREMPWPECGKVVAGTEGGKCGLPDQHSPGVQCAIHPPDGVSFASLIPRTGVKFDRGKPRYDLIPAEALEALAELYAFGCTKYEERNWEAGTKWGRFYRAMISHAMAWHRGERQDQESGAHHLIAVAWNAFALYCYEEVFHQHENDDRPRVPFDAQAEIKKLMDVIAGRTPPIKVD